MKQDKLIHKITEFTHVLNYIIAGILAVAVISGLPKIAKYIILMFQSGESAHYELFTLFLKHALLLVVGIEMIIMLVTSSYKSLVTLVMFVIARKMLVHADDMLDILLGCISLMAVFATLKFFIIEESEKNRQRNIYSAATEMSIIERDTGKDFEKCEAHTLGGLVSELCKNKKLEICDGEEVDYENLRFTLISTRDGVIDQIAIKKIEDKSEGKKDGGNA